MKRQDNALWVATFAALVDSRGVDESIRIADKALYAAMEADCFLPLTDEYDPFEKPRSAEVSA